MKKLIFLLFVLVQLNSFSQSCLPEGIQFSNQEQIDQFSNNYPGCYKILGPVLIGDFSGTDSITSLEGLSQLTSFGDELAILGNNNLISLEGLESIQTIDGQFGLYYNPNLINVNGLQSLTSIGGSFVITNNNNLVSLEMLSSLVNVNEDMGIYQNNSLVNLNGLESLNTVGTYIDIVYNENLEDISGINNINPESISMSVEITNNPQLSLCSNQFICDFMSIAGDSLIVHDNKEGCNTLQEIHSNCDTTSVNDEEFEDNIVLYPNPTKRYLAFKTPPDNKIIEISIYDMTGKIVYKTTEKDNAIDVSFLNEGVFVLELVSERSPVVRKLFVKK